jgi:hypothetical protein
MSKNNGLRCLSSVLSRPVLKTLWKTMKWQGPD